MFKIALPILGLREAKLEFLDATGRVATQIAAAPLGHDS